MERLEAIEAQVTQLTEEELAKFRLWFAEFDAAAWDAQLARDAAAGKLDALAKKALDAHRSGRTRPL